MTAKDLARRIILSSPPLLRLANRVRDRAAAYAARVAGERRMNAEAPRPEAETEPKREAKPEVEAMELELYGLRSDLQRAVARAEAERERRMAAEAKLATLQEAQPTADRFKGPA